ncbi:MAG: hypothetical protein JJE07_06165 [Flavobacteriaceae bacterium]|nr:hypothetical protein [Flavobacteriaceae bacterium]
MQLIKVLQPETVFISVIVLPGMPGFLTNSKDIPKKMNKIALDSQGDFLLKKTYIYPKLL